MSGKLDLLVIGGLLVIDHIAVLRELPAPGETVLFPGLTAALDERYFGGNNVNLAAAAAALGLRVGLVGFTSSDFQRSGYRDYLDRVGITDRWLQVLDGQPIAHCYSFFDEGGASLTFMDYPATTAGLDLAVPNAVIESARQIVIIGGRRDDLSAGKYLKAPRPLTMPGCRGLGVGGRQVPLRAKIFRPRRYALVQPFRDRGDPRLLGPARRRRYR